MKPAVALILFAAALTAVLLAVGQGPFAPAVFEYGVIRTYDGVLQEWPVPLLATNGGTYLLVGAGKHGIAGEVRGLANSNVVLQGSLIRRGSDRMIEVRPDSLKAGSMQGAHPHREPLGLTELSGEVVDTKCYLGVMNPGEGKVHRQCAARCISGGVPVALATKDRLVILVGNDGRPVNKEVLEFAGERIKAIGRLVRTGETYALAVKHGDFRRE